MSIEQRETNVVHCIECDEPSHTEWRGWRAYLSGDPPTIGFEALIFYCPSCAEREFGDE
jgi:hypothetical protein